MKKALRNFWYDVSDYWYHMTPLGREMTKAVFYISVGLIIGAVNEARQGG